MHTALRERIWAKDEYWKEFVTDFTSSLTFHRCIYIDNHVIEKRQKQVKAISRSRKVPIREVQRTNILSEVKNDSDWKRLSYPDQI